MGDSERMNICAVILAAGKGTRMKSDMAKVLHKVFGRPMLCHVVDAVKEAGLSDVVVVAGHQFDRVRDCLLPYDVALAVQEEQLGTGHAVLCAASGIAERHSRILILCGDTPLLSAATLNSFIDQHLASGDTVTLMTTVVQNPTNYGRVIVDEQGHIQRIVEERDAAEREREIKEINAGTYLVRKEFLFNALRQVGRDNSQGEVYLTDIVAIAGRDKRQVGVFRCADPSEVLGVNSRVELAAAEKHCRERFNRELMLAGVTLQDPATTYIDREVAIGRDTVIRPHVQLRGDTVIGERCLVDSFSILSDCRLGDEVKIAPFSNLHRQVIGLANQEGENT